MPYEQKPGDFVLFKNDRKERDAQPDMTGKFMCPFCKQEGRTAAWRKDTGKGAFLSGKLSEYQRQEEPAPADDGDFI